MSQLNKANTALLVPLWRTVILIFLSTTILSAVELNTQEIELSEIKMRAIHTDAFYNEVVARRELRMKKPGERVIKVRASVASKAINGSNPEAGSSAPHPLFVKVLFNRKIQAFLLAVAYILIATAFLFFNEKEYKSTKLPRKAYG